MRVKAFQALAMHSNLHRRDVEGWFSKRTRMYAQSNATRVGCWRACESRSISRMLRKVAARAQLLQIYDIYPVKAVPVTIRNTGMCMDTMDLKNLSYEEALRNGTYSQPPHYHV